MAEIDEFKNLASKLLSDYEVYWKPSTPEMNYSEHAQRTREAIAQALREVHDRAVEECALVALEEDNIVYVDGVAGNYAQLGDACATAMKIGEAICRLKKSNS